VLTFGGRRVALVSNLARPDDPTALFHNPAGLADQHGVQIYFFLAGGFVDLEATIQALDPDRFPEINPAGCGQAGATPCPWPIGDDGYYRSSISPERYFGIMPYLGLATDLGFLGRRWRDVVLSIAFYSPNFYGAYLPEDAPTSYHIISGLFLMGTASVGFGWRINERISLGADFSYNFMYLSMSQKYSLVDALTPQGEEPSSIIRFAQEVLGDIRMDFTGIDHGFGWGVGAVISPLDWFHIGLRYTVSSNARIEGDVSFSALGEGIEPGEFEETVRTVGYRLPERLMVEMAIPQSLQAGVLFDIGWRVELSMDFRYWFYSLYQEQRIVPSYNPDDTGQEPFSEEALTRPRRFTDSFQVTGGVLVRPTSRVRGLELMLGFGYVHSPVPDETYSLDTPLARHIKITGGFRWRIDPHWRISLAYQCNLNFPTNVTTSETHPPTNVRGTSTGHVPAAEVTYTF
jgi:long-subunit fatty acid transport protein